MHQCVSARPFALDDNPTTGVIATLASVVSLFVTARVDLPIGAAIVCALGAALVLVEIAVRCFRRT